MKHLIAIAALGATLSAPVLAQDAPIGQLVSLSGNVSVGGSNFVSKANIGTPLHEGNTVLVSSNGRATVLLKNGCAIDLAASQHLRVTQALKCSQLQASVKQLASPYLVTQAPVPGTAPQRAMAVPAAAPAADTAAAPFLPALGILPGLGIGTGYVAGGGLLVNRLSGTSGS